MAKTNVNERKTRHKEPKTPLKTRNDLRYYGRTSFQTPDVASVVLPMLE